MATPLACLLFFRVVVFDFWARDGWKKEAEARGWQEEATWVDGKRAPVVVGSCWPDPDPRPCVTLSPQQYCSTIFTVEKSCSNCYWYLFFFIRLQRSLLFLYTVAPRAVISSIPPATTVGSSASTLQLPKKRRRQRFSATPGAPMVSGFSTRFLFFPFLCLDVESRYHNSHAYW